MNNSHYLLLNESKNPIAVIKKSRFFKDIKESIEEALRDEYDADAKIEFDLVEGNLDFQRPDRGYQLLVVFREEDDTAYTEKITIKPIWEY